MQSIVYASSNIGKLREVRAFFNVHNWSVLPQTDVGIESPEETGSTYIENALIKAKNAAKNAHYPVIADDAGLEVEVLLEKPGIFSARFAGEEALAEDNIQKLLALMAEENNRKAVLCCAMVYMRHPEDTLPIIAYGRWSGEILLSPVQGGGLHYSYDPIFYDPTLGKSAADMSLTLKNKVSHRGKALTALYAELESKKTSII